MAIFDAFHLWLMAAVIKPAETGFALARALSCASEADSAQTEVRIIRLLSVKRKWIIIAASIPAVLVAGGVFVARLRAKPRQDWKDHAIMEIARRTSDPAWIASEIATLKANASKEPTDSERWLSPTLIQMTNGEWIAYSNICSKQDSRIHDIFIGRASDGKWYYSTFHFCIGLLVLKMQGEMEGQPASISKFAEEYYLRTFDGHSDDCLQKTWPAKRR